MNTCYIYYINAKILNNLTFYNIPGRFYTFEETQYLLSENSQFIGGHYNDLWFVLKHAPAVAYINALVQCGILWFLIRKENFENISWKALIVGFILSIIFALSANVLIALSEKYNNGWAERMQSYVTSFYSFFGIMLAIAFIIIATLKIFKTKISNMIVCVVWCATLFCFSVVNYYTNDNLSRAWEKSQNRLTMLKYVKKECLFKKIPDNTLFYVEQLINTSEHGSLICNVPYNFEKYMMRLANNPETYHFSQTKKDLQNTVAEFPDAPICFIQAVEGKKFCELMMVFSYISHFDSLDITRSTADSADIFYYSPTKEYVLFYEKNAHTDSANLNAVSVVSYIKQNRVTHYTLREEGLNPLGFTISNLRIPTSDTIWLPQN